jgi:hypothetical protein
MTPAVRALGERPDIVLRARLVMIPIAALSLAMTWMIGQRLFSPRAALWATAMAGASPDVLFPSVEYRTDQLWAALWLSAMAVLVSGRLSPRRCFFAGALMGGAVTVSMKTSLLLAALVGAIALLGLRHGRRVDAQWLLSRVAAGVAGLLLAPGVTVGYFAARGAWLPFFYNVVSHNVVPGLGLWRRAPLRVLLFPAVLPLLWWAAGRIARASTPRAIGPKRALLFGTAGCYYLGLEGFWPLVTRQDMLPFVPMGAVLFAGGLVYLARLPALRRHSTPWLLAAVTALPGLIVISELAWASRMEPPWVDRTQGERALLDDVLHITGRGDSILDLRGETVFRPRPFYYALEAITLERIRTGHIHDDIAEHLVAARTPCVAADNPDFPPSARAFMNENYLLVGKLRVAGKFLSEGEAVQRFEIRIPLRYAIVTRRGAGQGVLDGTAYEGPRELGAGLHFYRPAAGESRMAVVWAEAIDRGRSPFP